MKQYNNKDTNDATMFIFFCGVFVGLGMFWIIWKLVELGVL